MKYAINKITDRITEIRMDVIPECKTNAYVIRGRKKNFIVDTGFGSETAEVQLEYCDLGKPNTIISTHYHWDHIWGNAFFPDARIICHVLCRENIRALWDKMIMNNGEYIRGEAERREPDMLFDSKLLIDDELELFYSPGHTNDCISIYDKTDKVLFTGDNFGDNDEELLPQIDCFKDVYRRTLEMYAEYDVLLYASGHNRVQGKGIIEEMLRRLP